MKKIKLWISFLLIAVFGGMFSSCSNDGDESSKSLDFTDIIGLYKITAISGTNSPIWLSVGQFMAFYADGSCTTGQSIENAWKNENGKIKTFDKDNYEPMYVYELISRSGNTYEVQMNGTLDDNTSIKLTLQKIDELPKTEYVGVWSDGKHFISINSDNYLVAYIEKGFIDSGDITIEGNVIKSHSTYFSKDTQYMIKMLTDSTLIMKVNYNDIEGKDKTCLLLLNKTTDAPAVKNHTLIGKTASYRSASYSLVTLRFSGYNTGEKTSTSTNCSKYPLTLFYIYINGKVYLQQFIDQTTRIPSIGGWTDSCNDGSIFVYEVSFASNGNVDEFTDITDTSI